MIVAVMKISHSNVMFVRLVMLVSMPYGCDVIGHKSCTFPPAM